MKSTLVMVPPEPIQPEKFISVEFTYQEARELRALLGRARTSTIKAMCDSAEAETHPFYDEEIEVDSCKARRLLSSLSGALAKHIDEISHGYGR